MNTPLMYYSSSRYATSIAGSVSTVIATFAGLSKPMLYYYTRADNVTSCRESGGSNIIVTKFEFLTCLRKSTSTTRVGVMHLADLNTSEVCCRRVDSIVKDVEYC